MASVWKKGPSWYVKYKDGTGRYRQVRTTASTKSEAKRIALELERAAERQRLGLEDLPQDSTITLGELVEWWLEHRCSSMSRPPEESRLRRHVFDHAIARVQMRHLTGAMVDERLREMEAAGYAPASVEHVRRKLRTIVNAARKARIWTGPSPFGADDAPPPRRIPRRRYELLSAEDVPLVLQHIAPQWRAVFAVAVYTGMRKGEILALRKRDVDLRAGLITVARSWGRDTTKTGVHATIPIAQPLRPFLEAAIASSKSDLVFPNAHGEMYREDVDLSGALRRALARAGIVDGWEHVCRRCKARRAQRHTWRHPDGKSRRCPTCGMRLWPKPIPRAVRWHDLRHTTATLLLRSGVPIQHVQRLLRHADVQTTVGTYGHIVAEDLRATLAQLPFAEEAPVATRLLPSEPERGEPPKSPRINRRNSGASVAGDRGFEPLAFGSGGLETALPGSFTAYQNAAIASKIRHLPTPLDRRESHPDPEIRQNFATRLLPSPVPAPLLSVRAVAARLGVSTATVYRLAESGELRHVRVSGAIRIHPEDLQAYLEGRR